MGVSEIVTQPINGGPDVRDSARAYIQRGWSVLPVNRGEKRCTLPGWSQLRITEPQIGEYFEADSNIGILLGEPSGGLTDADHDCDEARKVRPHFFPDTLSQGRGSKITHDFYSVPEGIKSKNYTDLDGKTILEVRSTGQQTCVEPSKHPSGEVYAWRGDREPLELSRYDLQSKATRAATAALLLRHLPGPGNGLHGISLALAGFLGKRLLEAGMDAEEATELVWSVLHPVWVHLAEEHKNFDDLRRNIESTINKLDAGDDEITGGKRFAELVADGQAILDKITEWWGWTLKPSPEVRAAMERRKREKRAKRAEPVCAELSASKNILTRAQELLEADGLVGERTNAAILILAAVSLLAGEPISAIIKGTSSVGKSEVIKRVVRLLPEEMIMELQSVSDKGLAYVGKDALRHKVLVIYELGGLGKAGSDALEMAKQGMTEGRIRRQIAESTSNGVKPRLIEVDGPFNVWTTTTKTRTDYELNNRVYELTPDDGRDQTRNIIRNVFADDRPAVNLEPVRALFTWIAGQDNRVVIPYGPALGEMIPASAVRMRREAPRLRNLIRAHAVLHQATRQRDEDGQIVATLEDYEAVRSLVEEFVGASSEKGVKPQVRETVTKAAEIVEASDHDAVTVAEMAEALNIDSNAAWRRIKAAFPYLMESEEKRDRKKQYELGEDLPAGGSVLPSTDELCNFASKRPGEGGAAKSAQNRSNENCKTRAKFVQNSLSSRGVEEEKPFTNRENSVEETTKKDVAPTPDAKLQNCKIHPAGCPDHELCVQNSLSFANSENPELWELVCSLPGDFSEWDREAAEAHRGYVAAGFKGYRIRTGRELFYAHLRDGYFKPKVRLRDGERVLVGFEAA